MTNIKLQSSDGEIFEVGVEIATASGTIKTMLETFGIDDDEQIIPIPKVDSVILKQIIQWTTFHQNDSSLSNNDDRKGKQTGNPPKHDDLKDKQYTGSRKKKFKADNPPDKADKTSNKVNSKNQKPNYLCPWDANFIKDHIDTLCDLMIAADYLNIPGLLDMCCEYTAYTLRGGKTIDEIRSTFNIISSEESVANMKEPDIIRMDCSLN